MGRRMCGRRRAVVRGRRWGVAPGALQGYSARLECGRTLICRFCAQDVHNIPFPPAFRRPGPGTAPLLPRKMPGEGQISTSRRRRRVGSLLLGVGRPWIVTAASETKWFRRYPPHRRPRPHNFARKSTIATLEIDRPYRPAAHIAHIAGRIDSGDRELSNGCLGGV